MGRKTNKEKKELNYHLINEAINRHTKNNCEYYIECLYIFDWESDVLVKNRGGFYYEYEIKRSRADFFRDFKKKEKHDILRDVDNVMKPNCFSFVVPDGLVLLEEVPERYGLYYINENGFLKTIRKPTKLHSYKILDEELGLTSKFYFAYRNSRDETKKVKKELFDKESGKLKMIKAQNKILISELKAMDVDVDYILSYWSNN